jgi:taurine dioxygenase
MEGDRRSHAGSGPEITFVALTRAIGAEVKGPDLRAPLSATDAKALRAGLQSHHVLFFRDQHLTDSAHLALAESLGEPMVHPFERAMGRTDPIHSIVDRPGGMPDRAGWHTDDSYLERPPAYAILRCEVTPEVGGDTGWCNMVMAFERLSPELQTFLTGLEGRHETDGGLLDYVRRHLPAERIEEVLEAVGPGASHPIVRTHPDTGQRALFFEPNFMKRIEGLSDLESRFVCDLLAAQVQDVSLQCRFQWRAGDVAIWDERTTQHVGSADHAGERRVMRRCTVLGERPR